MYSFRLSPFSIELLLEAPVSFVLAENRANLHARVTNIWIKGQQLLIVKKWLVMYSFRSPPFSEEQFERTSTFCTGNK